MGNKIDISRNRQLMLLLNWEGQLSNVRLRELFDLQSARASQWISEFRAQYPRWLELNTQTKTYEATYKFYEENPDDDKISLSQYLALVGLPSKSGSEIYTPVVSGFPNITSPKPKFFSLLSIAAKFGKDVEITYSSMAEPHPHSRIISPHSIVQAGPRWHVRGYSELNKQFRDYTLGRISDVKLLDQPSKFTINDDKDWLTEVKVRFVAHPNLTLEQQSVIRLEYFAKTMARVTSCRAPLVNYFINDSRAAIDIEKQQPPEYFLAVENVKEISKWLFSK